MAPIYETDLIGERTSPEEWRNFELWEVIEQRQKRNRRLWFIATAIVSLVLLSVPTVMENRSRWSALKISRLLAEKINSMKRLAAVNRTPYRISFEASKSSHYKIEKLVRCADSQGLLVEGPAPLQEEEYALLSPEKGKELGVPGLLTSFCYDPVIGSPEIKEDAVSGFAIGAANDLEQQKYDAVSIVLLKGPLAEISFK